MNHADNAIHPTPILKKGNHVLVVGLGKSGFAAVRFLLDQGMRVSVSEGGRAPHLDAEKMQWLQEKGVHCEVGGHSSELFAGVDAILLSPGVPLTLPALAAAREKDIPIFGELALARDYLRAPMVAITGTNGKSTATTLVGDLLRAAGKKVFVGGNLGTPLCEYLAGPQEAEWVVLEVSSFQLDTAGDFRPQVAILLNITPDHLDRYPSFAAYGDSKWSIFRHQQAGDVAILDGDDPEVGRLLAEADADPASPHALLARRFVVGEQAAGIGASMCGAVAQVRLAAGADAEEYDLGGTPLALAPNSHNAMTAIIAARCCGCPPEAIRRGLAAFAPLPHRLALVAEVGGVAYYDDSKATNIGAVVSALEGMQQPVVLIAGGLDKGGDYRLMREIVRQKVKAIVLIGSARQLMAAAFADMIPVVFAGGLEEAVGKARELAERGDVVLLSPACASFDMFENYAHRGEVFRQAVQALCSALREVRGGGSPCPIMEALVA
ncbi:MAG: UDP-N-acetylmuramoyl-L-alanine--D-glutamate ligase [Thermodesulfobacteriota bacterium]